MPTWMVVEDEPDLYDMIVALYQSLDINDKAFTTGEDAVAWIDEVDNGYDDDEMPELALLDIRLPGDVNGIEVGHRMKQSAILQNTVIVLMTAFKLNPREKREAIERAGADLFVYKPFAMKDLMKKIKPILKRSN